MSMPKVAEEQATFMSKAKPSMPSADCTSMLIAGYGRCRLEQATITASTSAVLRPACSSASRAAATAISHCSDCTSSGRSGMLGHMRAGSRSPVLSIT